MRTRRHGLLLVVVVAVSLAAGRATGQEATEYGPPKGSLVIVGGNMRDPAIAERFIELAGGRGAKLVVVPTAGGNRDRAGAVRVYREEDVVGPWKKRGMTNVVMLHTHDPKVADTEAFVQPLREATAVWFDGGRQWNIVDSYANTLTYREFHKVLERGGVIGGSSAGATIQGAFLVRGAISGPDVMIAPEPDHQAAFGFLRRSAIDQHINARNRWDDLIPVIRRFPDLLGLGLSEDTAIVVTKDTFEVVGAWKVAVHDSTRLYQPWEKPYHVLSPGDVYDMKARSVVKLGDGTRRPAAPRQAR